MLSPYEILCNQAKRSYGTAPELPAQIDIKTYWTGIGFRLSGMNCAAPMDQVAEILTVPNSTRLPGVNPWVIGVSNIRGRLLPLIDLEVFFGNPPLKQLKQRRVLVLEVGDLYTGLIVDQIFGMQHFPEESYTKDLPQELAEVADLFDGSYRVNDELCSVFKPYDLAKNTAFMNAAS